MHIAQPLYEHLSGEGISKKSKCVTFTEDTLGAFKMLKKACLKAHVLSFADFNKPFLPVTDASKQGLGTIISQKQSDGQYHPVAYVSWSFTVHEYNYHSTKKEFLALEWAIAEQFHKYLLWKPFIVKTDNNPLTYIRTTPNLDATRHCWVESLVGSTFGIKYQKGWDNAAADALSQVILGLDAETVKSILDLGWSHYGINRKSECP